MTLFLYVNITLSTKDNNKMFVSMYVKKAIYVKMTTKVDFF